jgi:uncharacterized membrane protein
MGKAELTVLFTAVVPISELRGAIPLGILGFGLAPWKVFLLSIIGNILPIIPILLFLGPLSRSLSRVRIFELFFNWLFKRTRARSTLVKKYELIGLMLFVAIPLPFTGAWTGSVAAFLFGLDFKPALAAIFTGIVGAGLVITTLTTLGMWGVNTLLK